MSERMPTDGDQDRVPGIRTEPDLSNARPTDGVRARGLGRSIGSTRPALPDAGGDDSDGTTGYSVSASSD